VVLAPIGSEHDSIGDVISADDTVVLIKNEDKLAAEELVQISTKQSLVPPFSRGRNGFAIS